MYLFLSMQGYTNMRLSTFTPFLWIHAKNASSTRQRYFIFFAVSTPKLCPKCRRVNADWHKWMNSVRKCSILAPSDGRNSLSPQTGFRGIRAHQEMPSARPLKMPPWGPHKMPLSGYNFTITKGCVFNLDFFFQKLPLHFDTTHQQCLHTFKVQQNTFHGFCQLWNNLHCVLWDKLLASVQHPESRNKQSQNRPICQKNACNLYSTIYSSQFCEDQMGSIAGDHQNCLRALQHYTSQF
jgi:hypothetical protein